MLKYFKLELVPVGNDFDARLESETHVARAIDVLASDARRWIDAQSIIGDVFPFDVRTEIEAFFVDYLRHPFRNPRGGSRFGNLLWLDLLAKAMRPSTIIDSGTYTGASAWALARGAPNAKILSFDIDMSRLIRRVPSVEYIEADWTSYDISRFPNGSALAYFDDHVDQGRRLAEASARGIDIAIFDDDYSVLTFAAMAHGGSALPKISFILDESLHDGEIIRWYADGRSYEWKVDKQKLEKLKCLIDQESRLPNIAASIGFDQLPYRVVKLAR